MRRDLVYRAALLAISGLLLTTTTRRYTGLRHVPTAGGALVVCNHISLADPPVLANALYRAGRLPRALATAGLFRVPGFGRLLRAMGHIPVHRGTAQASDALTSALAALRAGELVMMYPEGGISGGDQWPRSGKTGAARLALMAGVPVIPVAQWGIQRVLPPWSRTRFLRPLAALFRPACVQVAVGAPLHLEGDPGNVDDVRAATQQLMDAIETQLETLRGPRPVALAA